MCFFVLEVKMMKATATGLVIQIKGELNLRQPTGKHFNVRGHNLTDMSFVILEKVMSHDILLRGTILT